MLAVPPLRSTTPKDEEDQGEIGSFPIDIDFVDFSLLDSIDFDLFIGIDDGDILPDLEMDSELLADFSVSSGDGGGHGSEELSDSNKSAQAERVGEEAPRKEGEDKASGGEEETARNGHESAAPNRSSSKGRKSSAQLKNSHGKRKVKVDWTPELHRRFVQAVEQLGVDKAVPSRILELMGIDCLTRHNIASHLQKYRSHRKHLLAREAEAASWSQRRQVYGGGGGGKRGSMSPWLAPTMGFPPVAPLHPFRPLHVWGHPSAVDPPQRHVWPNKHLSPPPPPLPTWPQAPPPTQPDHSYWHPHLHRVQSGLIPPPGVPCFPVPLPPTRYGSAPAPAAGIPTLTSTPRHHHPPHPTLSAVPAAPAHLLLDIHPSKESIDAAIGDALSKPWVPLPLGLKPPSVDSVMVELQRQGIPRIPPATAAAAATTAPL